MRWQPGQSQCNAWSHCRRLTIEGGNALGGSELGGQSDIRSFQRIRPCSGGAMSRRPHTILQAYQLDLLLALN